MFKRARPLLGTLVEISCQQNDSLDLCCNHAFGLIRNLESRLSFFLPDSDCCRFNRAEKFSSIDVSAETIELLKICFELEKISQGVFNPCRSSEHRQGLLLSEIIEISDTDRLLKLEDNYLLDFAGIGKGFIVDIATESLQSKGFTDFIINAGGDIRACGDSMRQIAIRDPSNPQTVASTFTLRNQAIASSGSYFLPAGQSTQIYNGRTGLPVNYQNAVSVISDKCVYADALTKLFYCLSEDRFDKILEVYNSTAIVLEYSSYVPTPTCSWKEH